MLRTGLKLRKTEFWRLACHYEIFRHIICKKSSALTACSSCHISYSDLPIHTLQRFRLHPIHRTVSPFRRDSCTRMIR